MSETQSVVISHQRHIITELFMVVSWKTLLSSLGFAQQVIQKFYPPTTHFQLLNLMTRQQPAQTIESHPPISGEVKRIQRNFQQLRFTQVFFFFLYSAVLANQLHFISRAKNFHSRHRANLLSRFTSINFGRGCGGGGGSHCVNSEVCQYTSSGHRWNSERGSWRQRHWIGLTLMQRWHHVLNWYLLCMTWKLTDRRDVFAQT